MQSIAIVFVIAVVTAALAAVIVMSDWDLAVIRAWYTLTDRSADSGRTTDWNTATEQTYVAHPWAPGDEQSEWPAPEPAVKPEMWRAGVVDLRLRRAGEPAMSLRDALELRREQAQHKDDTVAA